MFEPTIVTAFYDIRKLEDNNSLSIRNKNNYLDLANQFILQLPYNLVIFIEDSEDIETNIIYDFIQKNRNVNYKNKTFIYKESFKNTFFFTHLNVINNLWKKFIIHNISYEKDTPYYIILNNNKFHFLEKAIEVNVFNSNHFLWLDFGINHVAKNTEKIHDWILDIPDKIKQMCLNPYLEKDNEKDFFRFIYHHTSGGLFSGSKDNIKQYIQLFKNKVEQIYKEDWYQIDEAIMTMIQRENPDLFEFYYGDYQGIISNYLKPYHNIDLIFNGLIKTVHFKEYSFTKKIVQYLEPYFEKEENKKGEFYINFMNIKNSLKHLDAR